MQRTPFLNQIGEIISKIFLLITIKLILTSIFILIFPSLKGFSIKRTFSFFRFHSSASLAEVKILLKFFALFFEYSLVKFFGHFHLPFYGLIVPHHAVYVKHKIFMSTAARAGLKGQRRPLRISMMLSTS